MDIFRMTKPEIAVLGREGSTQEGEGFIQRLWAEANAHFPEIADLVERDAAGLPVALWGAMSDLSRSFAPWKQNFSCGLYLAGAQAKQGAQPPEGWTLWTLPASEYLCTPNGNVAFSRMLDHLRAEGLSLVGVVQELHLPAQGADYLLFPIRRK